ERLERDGVAAELELGVPDDAVDAGRRGRDDVRAPAERERKPKAVPRERELAETRGRDEVARLERERLAEDPFGLRVVRRVARLPDALLVREAERVERLHVLRVCAQLVLEASDLRLRVACREALLQLGRDGGRQDVACRRRCGGAVPEAAEGEDG